ncbi:hypothetical protein ACFLRH_02925 [Actinomycetota bacterium]
MACCGGALLIPSDDGGGEFDEDGAAGDEARDGPVGNGSDVDRPVTGDGTLTEKPGV